MKRNLDNPLDASDASNIENRGWQSIMNKKDVHTVPFSDVKLSDFLIELIIVKTGFHIDQFCWYSFLDHYKKSNDISIFNKEKYDIFPGLMYRNHNEVKVLHEVAHGTYGPFCSWNKSINVGFLHFEDNYGYFILCK